MKKILVLYYSRTGNTEKMAKAVAEGAQTNLDINVELNFHVEAQDLGSVDALIIGAPTYYHEMPMDFKKLLEETAIQGISLKGKIGATFGSYGWSGEAPNQILEIMKNRFQMKVVEPALLVNYVPNEKMLGACKDLGKKVSESLMNVT